MHPVIKYRKPSHFEHIYIYIAQSRKNFFYGLKDILQDFKEIIKSVALSVTLSYS